MSKTAVVILNWNGKSFLEKFLPYLISFTRREAGTIFVADNGSTDGSCEMLYDWFAQVPVIKLDKNYGFTGGYNRVFEEIYSNWGTWGRFDYYLLLNSDVEVTPGWLDTLLDFMESHPKVGVCSPKVLSFYRRDYFEHAGACGGMLDAYGFPYCRGRVLKKIEKDQGQYDEPAEVFWASGTAFMVRVDLWRRLGGLDGTFFAHMEEIDFCWRAKLLGWQIWAIPQSVIYHVGGGTLPNDSPNKLYLNFRNNLLMLYKNLPNRSRARIIFVRKCLDGCAALVYLFTGKVKYFKAVCKAHRDYRKMKVTAIRSQSVVPVPRSNKFVFFL